MTPELIQRLIALVQKHGDRVVLADPSVGTRAVVVLDLDEYERLRDGATASQRPLPLATPTPVTPTPVIASEATTGSERSLGKQSQPPAPLVAPLPPITTLDPIAETPKKKANVSEEKPIEAPMPTPGLHDLTQDELIAKINRDIGAWKTAQDRKRTDELKSAVAPEAAPLQTSPGLEEEERFFLEPIE